MLGWDIGMMIIYLLPSIFLRAYSNYVGDFVLIQQFAKLDYLTLDYLN
jgi:hypothetical protein